MHMVVTWKLQYPTQKRGTSLHEMVSGIRTHEWLFILDCINGKTTMGS